jgi:hypothetical protein
MEDEVKKKPDKTYRCGSVRAAVWTNRRVIDNAVVEVHSVRIDRSYKDGDKWKSTTTFAVDDLPKIVMVATAAYSFLRLRSEESSGAWDSRQAADDADGIDSAQNGQTGRRVPPQ